MRKKINKAAKRITKAVGGANLAEYAGAKIAKARAPKSQKKYIKSKASGKQAALSAASVGLAVSGVAGIGRSVSRGVAKKAAKAAKRKASGYTGSFKIKGQKRKVRVYEGAKRRGKTINKGNKWSR